MTMTNAQMGEIVAGEFDNCANGACKFYTDQMYYNPGKEEKATPRKVGYVESSRPYNGNDRGSGSSLAWFDDSSGC